MKNSRHLLLAFLTVILLGAANPNYLPTKRYIPSFSNKQPGTPT
jgi:hypothetical protein